MSIQQAGSRSSTDMINDSIQIALERTKYNISSRLRIDENISDITINNNKIKNDKILIAIFGVFRDGQNFNNFEPDGANYPEYIEPKYIFDDDNTSLYTYGSASVTNVNKSFLVEENGVTVVYKTYITLVEMTLNSTPSGDFLYMTEWVYKGTRTYCDDVFIITKNDNYVLNSPFLYINEPTPDIVSFVREFLDVDRINKDNRCFVDDNTKTLTELYIEPNSIPLDIYNTFDDNLILNFSSNQASTYIKITSNNLNVQLATDGNRGNDTIVLYTKLLTPYKTVGTNYFYEVTLSVRKLTTLNMSSVLTFFDSTKTQIKVNRNVFSHSSNYGHLNMFTQELKHNYPSTYSISNPITQRMLNDIIFTANRTYYSNQAQFSYSQSLPTVILGTTTHLIREPFIFYIYDSVDPTPTINLTDFKLDLF